MKEFWFIVGGMLLGIALGLPIWKGVIKKMLARCKLKTFMAGERIVKGELVVLHDGKVYSAAAIAQRTAEKQAYEMLRDAPATVNKNIE